MRDRADFGGYAHLRDFIDFLDVASTGLREKHQRIMSTRGKQMLHKITFLAFQLRFAGRHTDHPAASTALSPKFTFRVSFDISALRDRHDAPFVANEVLIINLALAHRTPPNPPDLVLYSN